MEKKWIVGMVGLLVVGVVAFVLTSDMGEAKQVAHDCGNPSCVAANGEPCNCGSSCCVEGACGGTCGNTDCAAKTGKSCNCGA